MFEKNQCWICNSKAGPFFVKGYGTKEEYKLCGSCSGTIAAIESRLYAISRFGKLDNYFTANGEDVPFSERDNPNQNNEYN